MAILSPRSANYERLEGGHGPARKSNPGSGFLGLSKRGYWKKIAIGVGFVILLFWLVGPRQSIPRSWSPYADDIELAGTTHTSQSDHPSTTTTTQANPVPLTYETDPDPSKTKYCTDPYTPTARLVQFALMIDAGSTGSRIHIYKFNNCGASPSYEYEVFKMTQPGLSSYAGNPKGAAESVDVLLDQAVRVVPEGLRSCTPVAVKATAGLRLLPGSQSADILQEVERRIKEKYPFQLQDKDGVVVMDGKDEGVYAWITANYLLETIRPDAPRDADTYAVLDLGGASTQIVFEPTFGNGNGDDGDEGLLEGEHKYDLQFGGRNHTLYQHSYLGYGLMKARMHVHRLVDFMASIRTSMTENKNPVVGNPCLARGTKKEVEIKDEATSAKRNVTMDGEQVGGFAACDKIVQLVMAKDAICEVGPCSFNGVYQPSLLDTFPTGKVLLLSYFYDRLHPLLPPDAKLTVSTFAETAQDVCLGREQWEKRWGHDTELMGELEGRPEWCLDLTFMHGLLRVGYEFQDRREMMIGKRIDGTELGWTLGATLAMVGGELRCRV